MTSNVIIQELKRILVEELDINLKLDQIDEKVALLDEGLALDSITLVELISRIEQNLNLTFEDEDLRVSAFQNLTTLALLLQKKLTI